MARRWGTVREPVDTVVTDVSPLPLGRTTAPAGGVRRDGPDPPDPDEALPLWTLSSTDVRRWIVTRVSEPGWLTGTIAPAFAVLAALYLTRGAWGAHLVSGEDTVALATRARVGVGQVFLHGHLDGWLPNYGLGYREFLFNGPGFSAFAGLVRLLTFGQLSSAGAVKVLAVGSFALFPLAVVFLARSFGLDRRASGLAGLLSLGVSEPYGIGLEGVFATGLVPQQVGTLLVCLTWGAVLRAVSAADRSAGSLRWSVAAAFGGAALVATHLISAFILVVLVGLSLPWLWACRGWRPRLAPAGRLGAAGVLAAGLGAFWLVPAIANRALHGPVTTWATPPIGERISRIWRGAFLYGPRTAFFVVIGLVLALVLARGRRRAVLAFAVVPIGFVVVCRQLVHHLPGNPIAIQLENRGIGLAGVVALLAVAVVLGWVAARPHVGEGVALLAAGLIALGSVGFWVDAPQQAPPPTRAAIDAAAALRRLVPAGARYVEARTYPSDQITTNVIHPDLWLGWASGRWSLNTFNIESSSAPDAGFLPDHLLDQPGYVTADLLVGYGVTHVVTTSESATTRLVQSPRFSAVWNEGPISVLAVLPLDAHPAPGSLVATAEPGSARLVRADGQRFVIAVEPAAPTEATIAVAWSPNWRGRIDGRALPLRRGAHGMIAVALPAGPHLVDLRFAPDRWDHLGAAISLLTLATLAAAWARVGVRRRRRAQPQSEPQPPELRGQ